MKKEILQRVRQNKQHERSDAYNNAAEEDELPEDMMETLADAREYDVQYYQRASIDLGIFVGKWYIVTPQGDGSGGSTLRNHDIVAKGQPRILAFDIECTKQPLKFPNADEDKIFMISYMADGEGFLIINREIVSEDIEDFEYTPRPEYPGVFTEVNEANEEETLRRFFEHCKELRPNIYVTYNGDYFDWPFIEKRATLLGMSMAAELGIRANRAGSTEVAVLSTSTAFTG